MFEACEFVRAGKARLMELLRFPQQPAKPAEKEVACAKEASHGERLSVSPPSLLLYWFKPVLRSRNIRTPQDGQRKPRTEAGTAWW